MHHSPRDSARDLKLRLLPELKITEAEIEASILARSDARKAKDFAKSDQERDKLAARGIDVRDTAEGTAWAIRYQSDE